MVNTKINKKYFIPRELLKLRKVHDRYLYQIGIKLTVSFGLLLGDEYRVTKHLCYVTSFTIKLCILNFYSKLLNTLLKF